MGPAANPAHTDRAGPIGVFAKSTVLLSSIDGIESRLLRPPCQLRLRSGSVRRFILIGALKYFRAPACESIHEDAEKVPSLLSWARTRLSGGILARSREAVGRGSRLWERQT